MASKPPSDAFGPEPTPTALATTLEQMAATLAESLPRAADARLRETLSASLEGIQRVSSAVRRLSLVYDPDRASTVAKQGEGIRSLAHTVAETIGQLAAVNNQIAGQMSHHMQELERAEGQADNEKLAEQLHSTVALVRNMVGEMQEKFDAISRKVQTANEGISDLERQLQEARERALYDALTRLHSRAALDDHLDAAIRGAETHGPWAFLIIDIDHFKRVNDTSGHIVGDALLFKAAQVVRDAVRWKTGKDFLARYGGDEFALVLAGANLAEAAAVAERVRAALAASRWQQRGQHGSTVVQVTISIGVAQYRNGDTAASLIQRADAALYRAKKAGRDKVERGE